jgi:hypothetical protein
MSKAGSSLLRTTLIRAADNARHQDPQLAKIYYVQMVERGKDHLGALCVVAASLAERFWAVMNRGRPYLVCDIDNTPVDTAQAKAIIARDWQGARRGPQPPAQQEGEGPPDNPNRTAEATRSTRRRTGRPSPTCMVDDTNRTSQPKRLKDQPP